MVASPHSFREKQPEGQLTPNLWMRGNPSFHYIVDEAGYTVTMDESCHYVYAQRNDTSGALMPSSWIVGEADPHNEQIEPNTMPSMVVRQQECGRMCEDPDGRRKRRNLSPSRRSLNSGPTSNLVILIRFADHTERRLPSSEDVAVIFNHVGPHKLAPSGSVHDYFLVNSYGSVDLQSEIYGWVTLSKPEAYYADGRSALTAVFVEALFEALEKIENDPSVSFSRFDLNQDGFVDTVTLVHSGYAAEWGRTDVDGQNFHDRIWSHKWTIPETQQWHSQDDVTVDKYVVVPSLWDTQGSEIGRIGVIVHELGHYFGLPDLYGGTGDHGIGAYGIMGNSWGFDQTQHQPPLMCPWSKILLGWVSPIRIVHNGLYLLEASANAAEVYRIDLLGSNSEYLLIENRQAMSFDKLLPQGGVAIWHIDETAPFVVAGHPGQPGWPSNGKHYAVALLQADGRYDLELGDNPGDSGDLFHANGVKHSLGPSTHFHLGPFPNTDSYQGGNVNNTGIWIYDVSPSGSRMSFTVQLPELMAASNNTPSSSVSPILQSFELTTTFKGGNAAAGNMFDIVAMSSLQITHLKLHTPSKREVPIEIWTKEGTHEGFEKEKGAWTLLVSTTMQGRGIGKRSSLEFSPILLVESQRRAFYITTTSGARLAYTDGRGVGTVSAANDDIAIMEGTGNTYPFGTIFKKRRWNGVLEYSLVAIEETAHQPAMNQNQPPSTLPSTEPRSIEPSAIPSVTPSSQPHYRSIKTTFRGGMEQSGNMFDVLALRGIRVTGFNVHLGATGNVQVEVYTRKGSFRGHETSCSAWNRIANISVVGAGSRKPTELPLDSVDPVFIDRFQVQTFYLTVTHTERGSGMRYSGGQGTGSLAASDDNIALFEGVGIAYPCSQVFPARIWNGVMLYEVEDEATPPTPRPTVVGTLRLVTSFVGGRQAGGIMFDIQAKSDIVIVGMSLHVEVQTDVTFEIYIKDGSYAGFEDDREAWSLLSSGNVTGAGRGQRTLIRRGNFSSIALKQSRSVGLYVTLTTEDMRYTDANFGSVAGENEHMVVTKGVGRSYPFGAWYPDRLFNGVIKYELV